MGEMQAINPLEEYIAAIINGETPPENPNSRAEYYLTKIAGEDVEIPEPVSRMDYYLAKLAGEDVEIPEPVNRVDFWLAALCGEDVETPEPASRLELWLDAWLNAAPAATLLSVTGAAPLSLPNAVARALYSLVQYGKTAQASTPTPLSPVAIACNNGVLSMVDDELPAGYRRVLGYQCNNNSMWRISDFHLRGSDTVRISFSITAACNVWGCYQAADASDNYDLYVSTTAGSKYLRYGSGTYASAWSADDLGERFDCVYTPTGTSGMPVDSKWAQRDFEAANDLLIGSTTLTGSSAKLKGNLFGDIIVDGRLHLIPCERLSDNVLGYYDTYGGTFYEPYAGYDGAVSLGYDGSHLQYAVVGTPETLTLSASGAADQTAGVADLLGITDYADEQDVITGAITKRVGVKVLKGTETISQSTAYGKAVLITSAAGSWGAKSDCTPVCSHFVGLPRRGSGQADEGTCFFNASGHLYFRVSDNDLDTFRAWLAEQYAAGTPVIVVFALSKESTDTAEEKTLKTRAGTNTVSVTANVSGINLAVQYYGKEGDG